MGESLTLTFYIDMISLCFSLKEAALGSSPTSHHQPLDRIPECLWSS